MRVDQSKGTRHEYGSSISLGLVVQTAFRFSLPGWVHQPWHLDMAQIFHLGMCETSAYFLL